MVIYKKSFMILIFITVILVTSFKIINNNHNDFKIGGYVHREENKDKNVAKTVLNEKENYEDRFQRPSKESPLKLKYDFKYGDIKGIESPYIPKGYPEKYNNPADIIHAYYSILQRASNMTGFHGGCGTIGEHSAPYPYAYELLSDKTKKEVSLKEFRDSFKGIGYMTLLKLSPAYKSSDTSDNIKYYFVEIETITGPPRLKHEKYKEEPSYFAYYYGLVTTEYNESQGWKIKSVDYIPEDFLCAPYHGWNWDSRMVVQAIYKEWYKLIDKIDNEERKDSYISIYASGKGKKYRFDFVRLTNGEDVLLHEYIQINNKWIEVNILKPEDHMFKLSILKFKEKS